MDNELYFRTCIEKLGEALYRHGHNLKKIEEASQAVDYLYDNGVFTSTEAKEGANS
jgi:hypothetical protein